MNSTYVGLCQLSETATLLDQILQRPSRTSMLFSSIPRTSLVGRMTGAHVRSVCLIAPFLVNEHRGNSHLKDVLRNNSFNLWLEGNPVLIHAHGNQGEDDSRIDKIVCNIMLNESLCQII